MSAVIFTLIVLLYSVIVHEIAHGAVALRLGDPTAKLAGRLTLNPLKHLDPFGSVLLPLLLFLLRVPILIGWAKPVPYDPRRLRNPRTGAALIGAAGPVSNLALAAVFGAGVRLIASMPEEPFLGTLAALFSIVVRTNIVLAIFNLVPIPPLDGSRVLFALLPPRARGVEFILHQYGFFLLLFFIAMGFKLIVPLINWLHVLMTGVAF